MSADYFQRAIPEPFRILGLPLKPLSLGRYRLLKRFDIAFVADCEAKADTKDLILGVLICSQEVDEFQAWLELPPKRRARDLKRWRKTVCPKAWLCRVPFIGKTWLRRKMPDLLEKIRLFQIYVQQHSKMPAYWDESGDERTSGAHWSHSVEVCLRSQVGWSRDEINEQPLSKALDDYFKFAESQGAIRLMTQAEIEQGEANAKIMAQLMMN